MHNQEHHRLVHSPLLRPEDWLRFVQLDPFPAQFTRLGLNDDFLRAVELAIMAFPDGQPMIRGSGGLRKLRISEQKSGIGKSGAYRVFYSYLPEFGIVLLLAIIAKNEDANVSQTFRNQAKILLGEIKRLLHHGEVQ